MEPLANIMAGQPAHKISNSNRAEAQSNSGRKSSSQLVITRAIVSRGWQTEERQSAASEINRDTDLRHEALAQKLMLPPLRRRPSCHQLSSHRSPHAKSLHSPEGAAMAVTGGKQKHNSVMPSDTCLEVVTIKLICCCCF